MGAGDGEMDDGFGGMGRGKGWKCVDVESDLMSCECADINGDILDEDEGNVDGVELLIVHDF